MNKKNVTNKCLIYCRVSSKKQEKEGHGLETQELRCRQFAASKGLEVVKVFSDGGVSGKFLNRPAIIELIEYLDDHWQDSYHVIFDDLKRFARDVEVHRDLKTQIIGRGAKLLCLNYEFSDTPESQFVETIFAAQNELERLQNKRQVRQKMKARLQLGYWCFYPPTGYEYIKTDEHGKIIAPITIITTILAEAINGFADDRFINQVDVMNFLELSNLPKLLNKEKIHFEFVKRILTEPLYAGLIEYPKWQITRLKGRHKAIITEETFDRVQDKLNKPERKTRVTDGVGFFGRRLINCALCGRPYTASFHRGKNPNRYYPHYTCNNTQCSARPKNIHRDVIESDFIELLAKIRPQPEILSLARIISLGLWKELSSSLVDQQKALESRVKDLEDKINSYVDLIVRAKSDATREAFETKITALDQELKNLRKSKQTKKEPNFEEALDFVLKFLGTPDEYWKIADPERRLMIHRLIFVENPQYSSQNGFGTPKLTLPFYIKHYVMDSKQGLVEVARVALASKRLKTYHLQV